MTVRVSKPAFNLREALNALRKKMGLKGAELLKAETAADAYAVLNPVMFRNRIINGDSRADQRYSGSAFLSTSNGVYVVDRWRTISTAANKLTYQKNMGNVASPAGFSSYLGISVTAADTSNTQWYGVEQAIEGTMVSDFGFGTSNASPVTLSFWVRSSIAGTYAVNLYTSSTRSFIAEYSINAPNTWEYKSVVIPGDPSSSVTTDNGWAMTLRFDLGTYTTTNGTAGVWNNGNLMRTSKCVNLIQNAGATWYVTGVQLEKGTVATPFEFRPYSVELALCQRYFVGGDVFTRGTAGATNSSGRYIERFNLPVPMRATPTLTWTRFGNRGADGFIVYPNGDNTEATSVGTIYSRQMESTPYFVNAAFYNSAASIYGCLHWYYQDSTAKASAEL